MLAKGLLGAGRGVTGPVTGVSTATSSTQTGRRLLWATSVSGFGLSSFIGSGVGLSRFCSNANKSKMGVKSYLTNILIPRFKPRSAVGDSSSKLFSENLAAYSAFAGSLRERSVTLFYRAGALRVQLDKKLHTFSMLFLRQCNQVLALRVRRAAKLGTFYSKLGYDRQYITNLIQSLGLNLVRRFYQARNSKGVTCALAAVGLFNWKEKKIEEQELTETADEVSLIRTAQPGSKEMNIDSQSSMLDGWEKIVSRDNLLIYRKPLPESDCLYEYKVFGTFKDIPARAFYNTQLDVEYRKQWDKLVKTLQVIDRDADSGTEVVQWVAHFPYPMYPREYIYLRRAKIDLAQKLMVIVARQTSHPSCPISGNVVRVDTYESKMVIKPHSNSFDENGLDYIMTYHDDPQWSIPSVAFNWMATTGVPDFLEKIHVAARTLHEKRKNCRPAEETDYHTNTSGGMPL